MNFTEIRSSYSVAAVVEIMQWRQSNDKHIYAKSGKAIHTHVSLGLNALTLSKK